MEDISTYADYALNLLLDYGPQLVLAILTLVIGLWLIKMALKGFSRLIAKRELDPSLQPFLKSLLGMLLKTLLVISVMGMVGIEMTSFIAILGAVGLAVGMALSGTLQNFAGGIMILIFKPYKVGDYIDAQGYSGSVKEIQIFNTILTTPDNKTIIIPNGGLSNSSMINYSTEPKRRVDFVFGIGYQDDIDRTKAVLRRIMDEDERVLKDPEPFIALNELADSSVNFVVRAWVKAPDYWAVYFDTQEKVKKAFDKEGISIPYPQQDLHIFSEK
jgi:small conductance mechanosensitive channel